MWSDASTEIAVMRQDVAAFIREREWGRYHAPINVASATAGLDRTDLARGPTQVGERWTPRHSSTCPDDGLPCTLVTKANTR